MIVKNDPNEEEKANEFAIKNYKKVQNLVLKHINHREGTIKPKGEVYPLRINLGNFNGYFTDSVLGSLDIVEILTGGECLPISSGPVFANTTLQERAALLKDINLKNPETKLIFLKKAVRVWNQSNKLGETEDIVFEGHGYRGDLEKPYSEENKVVNMQSYMTPENIAEIVTMINKPEDWHGRILLMGCHTADLVDSVAECLSNKFLVMGLNKTVVLMGEDTFTFVFAGFIRDDFLKLTENEKIILLSFYIFCKSSINNLIGFMKDLYENSRKGVKNPKKIKVFRPIEELKGLKGVGEKLKGMGYETVLDCILDEQAYNKLMTRLDDDDFLKDLAVKGLSEGLKILIDKAINVDRYIRYFESEIFHMLNFDESDPYVYTRKPELVAVAASGACN